jgi:hypothetical protein
MIILLVNLESRHSGTVHAFDFYKCARRNLLYFCLPINRPSQMVAMTKLIAIAV